MSEATITGRLAARIGVELGLDAEDVEALSAVRGVAGDFDPYSPGAPADWRDSPMIARVVRVLDAYLDMIREHENRNGFSPQLALSYLTRLAPSHFDPAVVLACGRALRLCAQPRA